MIALLRRAAWPRGSIQRGAHVQLRPGISRCPGHGDLQRVEIAPDTLLFSYVLLQQGAAAL